METLVVSHIPDRAVDLVHRRAISRNTHYMLTEEEAAEIRNDERVIACERLAKDRGIVPDYLWAQTMISTRPLEHLQVMIRTGII